MRLFFDQFECPYLISKAYPNEINPCRLIAEVNGLDKGTFKDQFTLNIGDFNSGEIWYKSTFGLDLNYSLARHRPDLYFLFRCFPIGYRKSANAGGGVFAPVFDQDHRIEAIVPGRKAC